jgi:hypothetical protein
VHQAQSWGLLAVQAQQALGLLLEQAAVLAQALVELPKLVLRVFRYRERQ